MNCQRFCIILLIALLLAACGRPGTRPPPRATLTPAAGPPPTEAPSLPTPAPEPTATVTPAGPTATTVAALMPLEWPADVGASHFGLLVGGRERVDLEGVWIRPHPGPFIWGHIEEQPGEYRWERPDQRVADSQQQRLAILATIWPFATWDQESCHADQPRAEGAFREFGDLLYSPCCRYALEKRFDCARDGCLEHLTAALAPWGIPPQDVPDPLSLFFRVERTADGQVSLGRHDSQPGAWIELRAEMDCVVAISTCSVPLPEKPSTGYRVEIR